ncbi:MAG: GGDEF domain-containing protein [candidate division Zixibacteria bacterium]|nr:GGDEF domain-containing protein [candidate division Zixibacteria bacterium]
MNSNHDRSSSLPIDLEALYRFVSRVQTAESEFLELEQEVCAVAVHALGFSKAVLLINLNGVFTIAGHSGAEASDAEAIGFELKLGVLPPCGYQMGLRPIDELDAGLLLATSEWIRSRAFDTWVPLVRGDTTLGLFLLQTSTNSNQEMSNLAMTLIAQALSAKLSTPESRTISDRSSSHKQTPAPFSAPLQITARPVLKLIRHHNPKTLTGEIIEFVKSELNLGKVAYWYHSTEKPSTVQTVSFGVSQNLATPDPQLFDTLVVLLSSGHLYRTEQLDDLLRQTIPWTKELSLAGLSHVVALNISGERRGLLALDRISDEPEMRQRLQLLQTLARNLMENAESFEKIEELSFTDPLTGLSNQRYFNRRLVEEIDRARRYERSVALVIFDFDDLKGVNDRYGHQAGDAVITSMGSILSNAIRTIDVIARYGGDEFCVIMPDTDRTTCEQFMVRLQTTIGSARFSLGSSLKEIACTISLGGAVYPFDADNSQKLLYAADMALLKAKETGRNRAMMYESTAP